MKNLVSMLSIVAVATLAGCSRDHGATMVLYAESEQGVDPYTTRTIVTPEFMRMDFNTDENDFILLERKTGVVYSVVSEQKTIVVLTPKAVTIESPIKLTLTEEQGKLDDDVPLLEGKRPEYYRYLVNGELCMETISVAGILADVGEAYKQYMKTLAAEHARLLPDIPADMVTGCDVANNIYAYGRQFEHGFPINEWYGEGNNHYKRQMVNFERGFKPKPELFKLPEDYRRYSPEEMSGSSDEAGTHL